LALRQLEAEAYAQMTAPRGLAKPFSIPLFDTLAGLWGDYLHGVYPRPGGRLAQRPALLLAFNALDRAKARAEDYLAPKPPPAK
jgi:hypothetical protein